LTARTRRRGRSRRRKRAAEHQPPTPAGLAHRLAEIARALRVHSKKMLSAGGSANTGEMKDDFAALDRPPKRRAVNDISIHQINWQAGQLGQIARPSHQAANLPTEAKELPRQPCSDEAAGASAERSHGGIFQQGRARRASGMPTSLAESRSPRVKKSSRDCFSIGGTGRRPSPALVQSRLTSPGGEETQTEWPQREP